jgi:3'-5' exoribonuclease
MEGPSTQENGQHRWARDIREEGRVWGSYLVKEKRSGTTRKGEPFISLTLGDRTGDIEGRIWDNAPALSSLFSEGDVVEIEGQASLYRNQVQVTVNRLKVAEGYDPGLFLEVSERPPSEMLDGLRETLKSVRNGHLRSLIDSFMGDKGFLSQFSRAPAAKGFHHSHLGGLLEHTLSVCRLALRVSEHYPRLDRDLLLTAAFLHDIGKVRELKYQLQVDYSDEGRLLGHLVIGVAMLNDKIRQLKRFPDDLAVRLTHMILSHHGEYVFGSPKRPKFLEAFALHFIDDLDAKMNGLARFMDRDRQEGAWTDFNRMYERFFLKGGIVMEDESRLTEDGRQVEQGRLFSAISP